MVRLIKRDQIPNGLSFYLAASRWSPRPNSSFQGIVESLYRHLQLNPTVLTQLGWQLDLGFLSDKVDEWNANLCQKMGWKQYIQEVAPAVGGQPGRPFRRRPAPAPDPVAGRSGGAIAAALPVASTCCGGRRHAA